MAQFSEPRVVTTALAEDPREYERDLRLFVNGQLHTPHDVAPATMLVDWLRAEGYTGTKIGCRQGGCGACTVLLSRYDPARRTPIHLAVNACLRPLCSVDGMAITTIEGIGSTVSALDPVQHRIVLGNGSQCGFCTPGFVMTMHAFLRNNAAPTQRQIEDAFDGNLCRCTGYRPILQAMKTCAVDADEAAPSAPPCTETPPFAVATRDLPFPDALRTVPRPLHFSQGGYHWFQPVTLAQLFDLKRRHAGATAVRLVVGATGAAIYDRAVEDPRIQIDISAIAALRRLVVEEGVLHVGAAVTYAQLLEILDRLIAAMPPDRSEGLQAVRYLARRTAGAQVRNVASLVGNLMLAIAHAATGSPFPSDAFTILAALGATVTVASPQQRGETTETYGLLDFARAYNEQPELRAVAIVLALGLPLPDRRAYAQAYKVARRPQMAHALVNAGFHLHLTDAGVAGSIAGIAIVYGGIAPIAVHARATERFLIGKRWTVATLRAALPLLAAELDQISAEARPRLAHLPDDGVSDADRRALALAFFYKFFLHVAERLDPDAVSAPYRGVGTPYVRPVSSGRQDFEACDTHAPAGEPVLKQSAFLQATGEAMYVSDLPLPSRGLHAAPVVSQHAHARFGYPSAGSLEGLDARLRERFGGAVAYITARDLPRPAANLIGLGNDEPIFADGTVTYCGQLIGLAVAETEAGAQELAQFIERHCITYGERLPAVLSIEAARDLPDGTGFLKDHPPTAPDLEHLRQITRPGSDEGWLADPVHALPPGHRVVSGRQRTAGQAHFYLETQAALAVPGEQAEMTVYAATQDCAGVQQRVAQVLGVPQNRITVEVRRIGGSFGGKTNRSIFIACAVALAAARLRRPVRLVLERPIDTAMIGKRHPFLGHYHILFTPDGIVRGIRKDLLADGGHTYDISLDVMTKAQLQGDSAYMIATYQSRGDVVRTNTASNTAMRAFGLIQATLIQEEAIEHMAYSLNRRPEDIRRQNLYRRGDPQRCDATPYGQPLQHCIIDRVWDILWESAEFEQRERAVGEFNRRHRWRKRGISMMPLKYGVAFSEAKFLNQGGALININSGDGSVLIHHGGVEVGQGIMTKMAQIAAHALNIPLSKVSTASTSPNIVPNASPTDASTGSDLNGGAIYDAAGRLRERLEAFCRRLRQRQGEAFCTARGIDYWNHAEGWKAVVAPEGGPPGLIWEQVVRLAYLERVDLSARGFFRTPGLRPVDAHSPQFQTFYYFTYSAAASEVEIDVLTGETTIVRADILYDAGHSLNPAIDVGQVEGGFVQGIGNVLTEELIFEGKGEDRGRLNTANLWTYKPPCSQSIPLDFRVNLLRSDRRSARDGAPIHPAAILSSKGVGEPPLVLASTVFFAIKRAILAARQDRGIQGWFELDAPATPQRVRAACGVRLEDLRLR